MSIDDVTRRVEDLLASKKRQKMLLAGIAFIVAVLAVGHMLAHH